MSKVEYNEVEHGELEVQNQEISNDVEITDPEYFEKLKHEGWQDLKDKPRWCTDILFLLLIIACWVVMTIVGFCATGIFKSPAIPAGDPNRLIYPSDYEGNICGHSPGVKNKRYGYYLPDRTVVCVKSCPSSTDYNSFVCHYDIQSAADNSTSVAWQNVAQIKCMYDIETVGFVRRCLPKGIDIYAIANTAAQQAETYGVNTTALYATATNRNTTWFTDFIGDIYSLLGYVFGFGIGVTVGVALLYLFLLQTRGLLFLVLWTAILGVLVFLLLGSFLLWSLANRWDSDGLHSHNEVITMRVFAYFGLGLSAFYFCVIVVLRKRIQLAIGIVKQAARALMAMPNILFLPLAQALGIVCFMVPWVIYVLALASSGSQVNHDATYTDQGQTFTYTYKTYSYQTNTRWAFLYMLFCWFWTSEFLIALGQIIVALSFSRWYFTRDKSVHGWSTVNWAFGAGIIYHAGTAAFGSLFVAIIKTIRAVLLYLQKQAKKSKNKIVEYIICMIGCCLWCLEKILKFINKNAYIITAIYGYGFCSASRKAFWLLLRNILRVSAVGIVSTLLLLIGRIFIPLATTVLCYFAIGYGMSSHNVSGIIAPLVFVFFLSYWITSMFLEIYGMGIETILLCFIADEEMFEIQDRFAEGELRTTIEKTAFLHASIKRKKVEDNPNPNTVEEFSSADDSNHKKKPKTRV